MREGPKPRRRNSASRRLDLPAVSLCACGCGATIQEKDRYGRVRRYVSGHNNRKYTEPGQHKREWNHRHREQRMAAKARFRYRRRVELIRMLGGRCEDCGKTYDGRNGAIFHLHHRDAADKRFEIGWALTNRRWAEVVAEAQKCVLLCANCHSARHGPSY